LKIKYLCIIFLLCVMLGNLNSLIIKKEDFSKGPLYGKNMYIPFFIYYNLPGISAKSHDRFSMEYHINSYYTNDNYLYYLNTDNNGGIDAAIMRDYESLTTEIGFSFFITKYFQTGIDLRLNVYYGGFLDNVIESYHSAFGFPNGGREYIAQNQLKIDIKNDNGVILYLNKPTVSFGDIDLWCKYTFFEKKWVSLAALGAFKIPTGRLSGVTVSGSGYPDFALGILADFRPVWILSFYAQAGIIVPLDSIIRFNSKPYPMFNGLAGIELNPLNFFSLIVQFNLKTSPLTSNSLDIDYRGNPDYLSRPQINTLVGFVFQYKGSRWQIYIEEDSFTNAGTDITFNLSYSQVLRIKSR